MKKLMIVTAILLGFLPAHAVYNLSVGDSQYLEIPEPSNGWIDRANWSCDKPEQVEFTRADQYGAIIYIAAYFEGIASIECSYSYSWYDTKGTIHVGSSSCFYSVQCVGCTVQLSDTDLTMNVGETYTLSYTVLSGSLNGNRPTWSSDDTSVCKVSSSGKVTAVAAGATNVWLDPVTGPKVKCRVTVSSTPPSSITLTPAEATLGEGKNLSLTCTFVPAGSWAALTWKSSNTSVATVSDGTVKGVGSGTATITATTSNGLSATCQLTVQGLPKSVSLSSNNISVACGYTVPVSVTFTPSGTTDEYEITIDDKTIAVASGEKISGVNIGTTTISVKTANGLQATGKVTVKEPANGLEIENVSPRLKEVGSLVEDMLKNK